MSAEVNTVSFTARGVFLKENAVKLVATELVVICDHTLLSRCIRAAADRRKPVAEIVAIARHEALSEAVRPSRHHKPRLVGEAETDVIEQLARQLFKRAEGDIEEGVDGFFVDEVNEIVIRKIFGGKVLGEVGVGFSVESGTYPSPAREGGEHIVLRKVSDTRRESQLPRGQNLRRGVRILLSDKSARAA